MAEIDSDVQLTKARLREGVWEGLLHRDGDDAPSLSVTHLETALDGVDLQKGEDAGTWRVRVPIPASTLSDGVQTYLILDQETGTRIASFAIAAGAPLSDDLRAEVDLLRMELDMLKRAFRRHCVETGA